MDDQRNLPIYRTAYKLYKATSTPFNSGEVGLWYDGVTTWLVAADGSQSPVGEGAASYAPVRTVATSLPNSATYSSVTQTWTAGANAALVLDSVTMAVNDRFLRAAGDANDGIFVVTAVGAGGGGGSHWTAKRASDQSSSADFVEGGAVAVWAGTISANTLWELSYTAPFVLDTTVQTWTQAATAVTFAGVKTALGAATSAVGMNGQKISSGALPTAANDFVIKSYVDNNAAISAGTLSNVVSGTYVLSNSNNVTFGLSGSTITASTALSNVHYWDNDLVPQNALFAQTGSGAVNLSLQRMSIPYGISATQMDLLGALTVVASTHVSYTLSAALYSFNASTLSLASSATFAVSVNSSVYTNYSGTRYRSMGLGTWNVTPGEYMMGMMVSLNGPAGTTGSFSFFGQNSISINGVEGGAANYTAYFGHGLYSAATGAFPSSISLSQINQTGSASTNNAWNQPYFRFLAAGA